MCFFSTSEQRRQSVDFLEPYNSGHIKRKSMTEEIIEVASAAILRLKKFAEEEITSDDDVSSVELEPTNYADRKRSSGENSSEENEPVIYAGSKRGSGVGSGILVGTESWILGIFLKRRFHSVFQDLKNIGKTTGRKAIVPQDEIWYLYFCGAYVSTLVPCIYFMTLSKTNLVFF